MKQHFEPPLTPSNPMDYATFYNAAPQPQAFGGPLEHHSNGHSMSNGDFPYQTPPTNGFDFQAFDAYNHFNAQGIQEPPTPQSQPRLSIAPVSHDGMDTGVDMSNSMLEHPRQGSNSANEDDDDPSRPAQSRRKAQNRAAQRAFRERKEKHVKDLEAQLAALRESTDNISTENERLRLTLQKVSTENEILKATTSLQNSNSSREQSSPSSLPDTTGPMHFSPQDFYGELLDKHDNKTPSHRIVVSEGGGRLMGAGATWDYILNSKEFKLGTVDVSQVSEQLKGRARCDGQGPVFDEGDVRRAIEASAVMGNDELI